MNTNTIPQRLREIAVRIGTHDMAAYVQLRAIAAELEAPVADAVQARGIQEWADSPACAGLLLVRQRDHLAAVAALQSRINELEARQWFLADETDDSQDDVWSYAADAYAMAAGALRGHLEWRDRIRAAVRVLIASRPQPDNSKEQP